MDYLQQQEREKYWYFEDKRMKDFLSIDRKLIKEFLTNHYELYGKPASITVELDVHSNGSMSESFLVWRMTNNGPMTTRFDSIKELEDYISDWMN